MRTELRQDIRNQYMVITPDEAANDDYRLNMITQNKLGGFAPCKTEQLNGRQLLYYDITGKTRLSEYLSARQADNLFFKSLFSNMASAMERLQEYLLDPDGILLEPEMLFIDSGDIRPCFLYYPYNTRKFSEGCRALSEGMLNNIKQDDIDAVKIGYGFYKNCVTGKVNADTLRDMAAGQGFASAEIKSAGREVSPRVTPTSARVSLEDSLAEHNDYDKYNKDFEDYGFLFSKDSKEKTSGVGLFNKLFRVKEKKEKYQTEKRCRGKSDKTKSTFISQTWLVSEKGGARSPVKLDKEKYLIGQKTAGADIALDSAAVSRAHAKLMCENGDYYVTDLSSKNGTKINGKKIESGKPIALKNGDRLSFADVSCVYRQKVY